MPRVENMGEAVDEWCNRTGNGSSTWDVCITCYEELDLENGTDLVNDKLEPYNGDPDGEMRGGNVEHPDFGDDLCSDYRCMVCGKPLTEEDN